VVAHRERCESDKAFVAVLGQQSFRSTLVQLIRHDESLDDAHFARAINCNTPTALTLIGFVADARDVRSGT
jgi:hypothetical protein